MKLSEEKIASIKKQIAKGQVWFCMSCFSTYKELPESDYEDGHVRNFCKKCGCDLFERLEHLLPNSICDCEDCIREA